MPHQPLNQRPLPSPALRTKPAHPAGAPRTQRDRVLASLIANPRLPGERAPRGRHSI